MVVFSITPVQDFIGKARKLRDYWTGSVILSYLAFVGIARVMQDLGPDHVLYPSLHNQSLVDLWLCQEHGYLKGFLRKMIAWKNCTKIPRASPPSPINLYSSATRTRLRRFVRVYGMTLSCNGRMWRG